MKKHLHKYGKFQKWTKIIPNVQLALQTKAFEI
jgi:hypothetical protein